MLVCKRSVTAFVGIFFIGWILGIFFVITFLKGFRGDDDGASGSGNLRKRPPLPPRPLPRDFPEVHSGDASAGLASVNEIIRHHHAVTSEILSNLNDSAADKGGKYQIFFDWPVTVSLFTLVNYKALESVMNVYGADINYRVLLPAPVIGGSQRFSNQLSLNQFRKYERRGYDIQVEAVGQMEDIGFPSTVARDYWSKWSARCCLHCGRKCRNTDRTQPFHVHMFIRLSKLWQYGGLFTDFSFFFVGPLDAPMITQGYYINKNCTTLDPSTSAISPDGAVVTNRNTHNRCFISTLLVFNTPKSLVIACVLKKYEDLSFVLCLERDPTNGGADCISAAFLQCFQSLGVTNDLAHINAGLLEYLGQLKSEGGHVMAKLKSEAGAIANALIHHKRSAIPSQTPKPKPSVSLDLPEDPNERQSTSSFNITELILMEPDEAFDPNSVINNGGTGGGNTLTVSNVLQVYGGDPLAASEAVLSVDGSHHSHSHSQWKLSPETRAFWLGAVAFSGTHGIQQHIPTDGKTPLTSNAEAEYALIFPTDSLLSAAMETLNLNNLQLYAGYSGSMFAQCNRLFARRSRFFRYLMAPSRGSFGSLQRSSSGILTAKEMNQEEGEVDAEADAKAERERVRNSLQEEALEEENGVDDLRHKSSNTADDNINNNNEKSRSGGRNKRVIHPSAPSVVLTGYVGSALHALLRVLSAHPQLLPPLDSEGFHLLSSFSFNDRMKKDTLGLHTAEGGGSSSSGGSRRKRKIHEIDLDIHGSAGALPAIATTCYRTRYAGHSGAYFKRCFPLVEGKEAAMNFTTIDANALYATDPHIPLLLKQDNPAVKAIFVVRHPVDRLYEDIKTLIALNSRETHMHPLLNPDVATAEFGEILTRSGASRHRPSGDEESTLTMDDYITHIIPPHASKLGALRDMVQNGSSDAQVIEQYYSMATGTREEPEYSAIDELFMQSIYSPAILHYIKVLGKENVLVVNIEELTSSRRQLIQGVREIFEFIGLCMPPVRSMVMSAGARTTATAAMTASAAGSNEVKTSSTGGSSAGSGSSLNIGGSFVSALEILMKEASPIPPIGDPSSSRFQLSQEMYRKLNKLFMPFTQHLYYRVSVAGAVALAAAATAKPTPRPRFTWRRDSAAATPVPTGSISSANSTGVDTGIGTGSNSIMSAHNDTDASSLTVALEETSQESTLDKDLGAEGATSEPSANSGALKGASTSTSSSASASTSTSSRDATGAGWLFNQSMLLDRISVPINFTEWNTRSPPSWYPKITPYPGMNDTSSSNFVGPDTGGVNTGSTVGAGLRSRFKKGGTPAPTGRPLMWFEVDVEIHTKGRGIMAHLLPARHAKEDSGFNTTIGMLTMF